MSNRLEKFVRDNREHFDDAEPAPQVWSQLQRELLPGQQQAKVRKMLFMRWAVAAAVVAVVGTIAFFSLRGSRDQTTPMVAQTDQGSKSNTNPDTNKSNGATDSNDHGTDKAAPKQQDLLRDINPTYAEEVYHFTRLIELKQSELKQIEKDDPALYKKFVSDINRLDSSYKELRSELPDNPNREQLLQAMIQNLRLQTELLNQQLTIIQKIKQAKTPNHESNSKSI